MKLFHRNLSSSLFSLPSRINSKDVLLIPSVLKSTPTQRCSTRATIINLKFYNRIIGVHTVSSIPRLSVFLVMTSMKKVYNLNMPLPACTYVFTFTLKCNIFFRWNIHYSFWGIEKLGICIRVKADIDSFFFFYFFGKKLGLIVSNVTSLKICLN